MTDRSRSAAIVAAAGLALASGAIAQDSVSRNSDAGNGLPGDALNAYAAGVNQRANYVVDLTPFTTSWGTSFSIAPILKGSRVGTGTIRFNAVNGSSSISQSLRRNAPYPAASYTRWTQPQGGVNVAENTTSLNIVVTPTGLASVFAVGFLEFTDLAVGTSPAFFNQIVGAQIAFDPNLPSRLYVTRTVAACNSPNTGQVDRSQLGYGSVDASGNIYFRADSFTASAPTNLIPGDNYFRVSLPTRTTSINSIDSAGATNSAASTWLLNNSGVTHSTPNCIPATLAGRPVLLSNNFAAQLVRESSPGVLTNAADHRPATADQRGSLSFSEVQFFTGSVGSAALLTKPSLTGPNSAISVFGVDSAGTVMGARTVTLPPSVQDSCDAFNWPLTASDFRHYDSQVTFRGGTGQVAIAKDQQGRALLAAVAYNNAYTGPGGGTPANPFDAILVARFDPSAPTSPVSWNAAAWVTPDIADGKDILGDYGADGVPNTHDAGEGDAQVNAADAPIGRLASFSELGTGKTGPSLSAPMFDSIGNLYFTASVALKRLSGTNIVFDFDQALVRAVYDPASFCYKLELVLRLGTVIHGQNSNTNYQIVSLGLADADSVSSQAPWSSSMPQYAWDRIATYALQPKDPRALAGLVLSSRVVYDTNNDGLYQDPTLPGGNALSPDEGYNVILYIGNTTPPPCVADVDNGSGTGTPDGGVTIDDLLFFLALFDVGDIRADVDDGTGTANRDGGVTIDDLLYFLVRFDQGC